MMSRGTPTNTANKYRPFVCLGSPLAVVSRPSSLIPIRPPATACAAARQFAAQKTPFACSFFHKRNYHATARWRKHFCKTTAAAKPIENYFEAPVGGQAARIAVC
jgi:hypothetical protein